MRLKALLYTVSIIKIDNAYWVDLLQVLSHKLRKLEWDMIYLPIFNFWGCLFESTNSLLLIGYIDIELSKDQIFLIKVFKLMIHTCSHKSCKIIHQVSVQHWFAYISIS